MPDGCGDPLDPQQYPQSQLANIDVGHHGFSCRALQAISCGSCLRIFDVHSRC